MLKSPGPEPSFPFLDLISCFNLSSASVPGAGATPAAATADGVAVGLSWNEMGVDPGAIASGAGSATKAAVAVVDEGTSASIEEKNASISASAASTFGWFKMAALACAMAAATDAGIQGVTKALSSQ